MLVLTEVKFTFSTAPQRCAAKSDFRRCRANVFGEQDQRLLPLATLSACSFSLFDNYRGAVVKCSAALRRQLWHCGFHFWNMPVSFLPSNHLAKSLAAGCHFHLCSTQLHSKHPLFFQGSKCSIAALIYYWDQPPLVCTGNPWWVHRWSVS